MKKVIIIGLVIILLAFSAVPVLADKPGNGQGNGNGAVQGNGLVDRDQSKQHDRDHPNNGNGKPSHPNPGSSNQHSSRMRTPFYLQGTITTINPTTKTLTVNVVHGNARVKSYIGSTLTVTATDLTMIFKITQGQASTSAPTTGPTSDETPGNRVPINFNQLAVGDKLAIHGNVVEGVYMARLITVYVKLAVGQPEPDSH
jgi:hypothetical protein